MIKVLVSYPLVIVYQNFTYVVSEIKKLQNTEFIVGVRGHLTITTPQHELTKEIKKKTSQLITWRQTPILCLEKVDSTIMQIKVSRKLL